MDDVFDGPPRRVTAGEQRRGVGRAAGIGGCCGGDRVHSDSISTITPAPFSFHMESLFDLLRGSDEPTLNTRI